jgi:hypothetical protein
MMARGLYRRSGITPCPEDFFVNTGRKSNQIFQTRNFKAHLAQRSFLNAFFFVFFGASGTPPFGR